jgi:hypothetical protein
MVEIKSGIIKEQIFEEANVFYDLTEKSKHLNQIKKAQILQECGQASTFSQSF